MKTVQIEQTSLQDCVNQAQEDRLILTHNGQPVALVIGLDEEQRELGQDASFWKLIEARRCEKSISREALEKSWSQD